MTAFENLFPSFSDPSLRSEILNNSVCKTFEKGVVLLERGQYVKVLPLVIQGSIKVVREDAGREILLYYILPGESCALSMTAYLSQKPSEIKAATTEITSVILLPTKYISQWIKEYSSWQEFALQLYHKRFEELVKSIEDVAFKKMDERLIDYLKDHKTKETAWIQITHQQIANDLGTSREVISRLLKNLENRGFLHLNRNSIKVRKPL